MTGEERAWDFMDSWDRLQATLQGTGSALLRLDRTLRHRSQYASHYRKPAAVKPSLRGRRHGW